MSKAALRSNKTKIGLSPMSSVSSKSRVHSQGCDVPDATQQRQEDLWPRPENGPCFLIAINYRKSINGRQATGFSVKTQADSPSVCVDVWGYLWF